MKNKEVINPTVDHISTLAGLRGIAVILVMLHHLPNSGVKSIEFLKFAINPGYLGVDIFFVLSGFLITRILITERLNNRPIKNFLVRRFLRIFPIYYLTVFIIWLFEPGKYIYWCLSYLSNFYYVINNESSILEHTWSLSVEEHFYLFWPFIIFLFSLEASKKLLTWVIMPSAVILAILTAYMEPSLPIEADSLIYRGTFYRIFSLGLGALFAFTENKIRGNSTLLWRTSICFFITGIFILPTALIVTHQWIGPIMLIGFAAISGAIVLAAIGLENQQNRLNKILCLEPLAYIGSISYGLYIYHLPIYYAFGLRSESISTLNIPTILIAIFSSFALAILSFHYIEKPLLKLKRHFY